MSALKLILSGLFILILSVAGCTTTTGEIRGSKFYLENDFTVDILDSDWETVRQEIFSDLGRRRINTYYKISFNHKKSNGLIGAGSFVLNDVGKARSLEVHVDETISNVSGMKLSQKSIKVDGVDALETVISGKYMFKYVFMKKGDKGYELIYRNTTTYFDQYVGIFDKFVESFKLL